MLFLARARIRKIETSFVCTTPLLRKADFRNSYQAVVNNPANEIVVTAESLRIRPCLRWSEIRAVAGFATN
jgi:CMP-N-acetylneuraminic acid synthetase